MPAPADPAFAWAKLEDDDDQPRATVRRGGTSGVKPLVSNPVERFAGRVCVPGDKSISHRAAILGALAVGVTEVSGLLEGDDVRRTLAAVAALGAQVERTERAGEATLWRISGVGVGGLAEPDGVLDLGNSGTGVRLLMGAVASQPITTFFAGDPSLSRRPMARIAEPLEAMGARIVARSGTRLPLCIEGAAEPLPIEHRSKVASAQVKSAVLLAGLNAPGITRVIEPAPTRDHTELMLRHFGARLEVEDRDDASRAVALHGQPELTARTVNVPGDISSAAFPLAAAMLVPGAELVIENVGINPLRTGLLETLDEMGAEITLTARREAAGEPVADLVVRAGRLRGVSVPAERAPRMIDEYPVLAVLAACAEGRTEMPGLAELRVKESDRLSAIADGLAACGVGVEASGDGLAIEGAGGPPPGGGTVESRHDHRIAMAFLVLGMAARTAVTVDEGAMIATSFPGFAALMNRLGGAIADG